jgi:proline iminopeptidase
MLLVLHTPGLEPGYLRACLFALGEPYVFVDYAPDGDVNVWVEQAERLRAEMGVTRWRVLGHGLGGLVAQAYTALHPARVERLLLCATAPRLGARFCRMRRALESHVDDDQQFRQLCLDVLPAAFGEPALSDEVHHLFSGLQFSRRMFLTALESPPPEGTIVAKTLILHGRMDRLVWLEEGGERLLDELPDAELIVFERSGHFPFLEQPQPFLETVDEFLHEQTAPGAVLPA